MAQCTSLACPRLAYWFQQDPPPDPDNRAMFVTFPSSQATRDCLGNTWCNYCIKQPALIAWAKKQDWPEIHTTGEHGRYAIGAGSWNWKTSIVALSKDAIDAFYAEVFDEAEAAS